MLSRFSHVRLFAKLWTAARRAPLTMGFSRQEHWSGLPFPPSAGIPDSGIESASPALQADSLPTEPPQKSYRYTVNFNIHVQGRKSVQNT